MMSGSNVNLGGSSQLVSDPWFYETSEILLYLVESPKSLLSPGLEIFVRY